LTSYKGEVAFDLEEHGPLEESGELMEMIKIPESFFRMGSGLTQLDDNGEQYCHESPVRTVSLPSFYIAKNQ